MNAPLIRKSCGCLEFNDLIFKCMIHAFEELNLKYPMQFPSKSEFIARWTESKEGSKKGCQHGNQ